MTLPPNRIRELRKASKPSISGPHLAQEMGVNKATISRWENRRGGIPELAAHQMAHFFGVSLDYLLGREDGRRR